MAIKHIFDAATFLNKLRATSPPQVTARTSSLQLAAGEKISINHFPAQSTQANAGWILFIHGMNYAGHNEPRIVRLCSALADCGYNVLAPQIDSVANFWIDFTADSKIQQIIAAIKSSPEWQIKTKLALMSISLTGTMSIHAAANPQCAKDISGILLFGSFANSNSFTRHILSNTCTQDYPKLIMIKNLLHFAKQDADLIHALHLYINDNYQDIKLEDPESESKQYLDTIARPEISEQLQSIINNLHNTEHYIDEYSAELEYIDTEFAKMDFPKNLPFPVNLIHGVDDNTIIYNESIALHKKLTEAQSQASVLVTPLIESHSNFSLSLPLLWKFILLSKAVGGFLADAQRS